MVALIKSKLHWVEEWVWKEDIKASSLGDAFEKINVKVRISRMVAGERRVIERKFWGVCVCMCDTNEKDLSGSSLV